MYSHNEYEQIFNSGIANSNDGFVLGDCTEQSGAG
jgi:hypothetical protein